MNKKKRPLEDLDDLDIDSEILKELDLSPIE
jgi:hypothetical protein